MNSKALLTVGFSLALGVLALGIFLTISHKQVAAPVLETTEVIKSSVAEVKNFNHQCVTGKTAFDALMEKSADVKFENSSLGKFITSINGSEQGNGKYWLYKINGKEASVSADKYICGEGEQVEWELK